MHFSVYCCCCYRCWNFFQSSVDRFLIASYAFNSIIRNPYCSSNFNSVLETRYSPAEIIRNCIRQVIIRDRFDQELPIRAVDLWSIFFSTPSIRRHRLFYHLIELRAALFIWLQTLWNSLQFGAPRHRRETMPCTEQSRKAISACSRNGWKVSMISLNRCSHRKNWFYAIHV